MPSKIVIKYDKYHYEMVIQRVCSSSINNLITRTKGN
jgi:hypothetical protein